MDENNKIEVLYIMPMREPMLVEIDDNLESMQELVGGRIEEYMPFEDEVALICNEEGKMSGEPLNRGILDEDGKLMDIIAGPFFITYAPIDSESFHSLPSDLRKKYYDKYKSPERFYKGSDGDIVVKKIDSPSKEMIR